MILFIDSLNCSARAVSREFPFLICSGTATLWHLFFTFLVFFCFLFWRMSYPPSPSCTFLCLSVFFFIYSLFIQRDKPIVIICLFVIWLHHSPPFPFLLLWSISNYVFELVKVKAQPVVDTCRQLIWYFFFRFSFYLVMVFVAFG